MATPDFQTIMLPLLRFAGDGKEHAMVDARGALVMDMKLSEDDVSRRLPSGSQTVWSNRVAWAKVHLDRAGLLKSTRRGFFEITDRGRQVLAQPPDRITVKYLSQYPEFQEFRRRKKEVASGGDLSHENRETPEETPEETLDRAYVEVRASLAAELLDKVKSGTPLFFEKLVVELLMKMGYGGFRREAGKSIGKGGDEGIDGVINEDQLGLGVIYIQAKKWEGSVGRPEIQKFVGALHGQFAKKGVFITTGRFSAEAEQYVSHIDPKVVLIDGAQVADYMIDFGVGVTTRSTYEIKRVDSDYFADE